MDPKRSAPFVHSGTPALASYRDSGIISMHGAISLRWTFKLNFYATHKVTVG